MSVINDILNEELTNEEYLDLRFTILSIVTKAIPSSKYKIVDQNNKETDVLTINGSLVLDNRSFYKMNENMNEHSKTLLSIFERYDWISEGVHKLNDRKTYVKERSFSYDIFNNHTNVTLSKFSSTDLFLFDSVAQTSNAISLDISTVRHSMDDDNSGKPFFTRDKKTMAVYLNADQFARLVQSKDIFIPCTIFFDHGEYNSISELNQSKFNIMHNQLEEKIKTALKPFTLAVHNFNQKYEAIGNLGVKGIKDLQNDVLQVRSILDSCRNEILSFSKNSIEQSKTFMVEKIQAQFEFEMNRIPEEIREQVKTQFLEYK